MSIAARVNAAVAQATKDALPFVPTHAEVAQALAPLVKEILLLSPADIVHLLRLGIRPGTWDVYVLAEVKSALKLLLGDLK